MAIRFAFVTLLALTASSALAQEGASPDWDDPEAPAESDYPQNYTQRPITLPRFTVRGDAAFTVLRIPGVPGFSDDYATGMNIGGGFGITDDLEVGISGERIGLGIGPTGGRGGLLPIAFTPDANFGDPYLYGRYRFLALESFELGAELGLVVPFDTNFEMVFALPFRARFGEMFSLDGGVEFDLLFADAFDMMGNPDGTDIIPSLQISIQPRLAPVDFLFFGIDTGVVALDFDSDQTYIPLGFLGGYVLDLEPTRIDIYGEFQFPLLFAVGPKDVFQDVWQINIGARAYIDLGG